MKNQIQFFNANNSSPYATLDLDAFFSLGPKKFGEFKDSQFDSVKISSEKGTAQRFVSDGGLLAEVLRVLKSGGQFTLSDAGAVNDANFSLTCAGFVETSIEQVGSETTFTTKKPAWETGAAFSLSTKAKVEGII